MNTAVVTIRTRTTPIFLSLLDNQPEIHCIQPGCLDKFWQCSTTCEKEILGMRFLEVVWPDCPIMFKLWAINALFKQRNARWTITDGGLTRQFFKHSLLKSLCWDFVKFSFLVFLIASSSYRIIIQWESKSKKNHPEISPYYAGIMLNAGIIRTGLLAEVIFLDGSRHANYFSYRLMHTTVSIACLSQPRPQSTYMFGMKQILRGCTATTITCGNMNLSELF